MAVAFDAVGPSSTGQVSTSTAITWTHTAGAGGTVAVVYLMVGLSGTGGVLGTFSGVTYGGVAMTALGSIPSGGSGSLFGGIFGYKITGASSGANTVAATYSSATNLAEIIGVSVSFTGAASLGTPAVLASSGSVTTGTCAVASTTAGGMCVAGVCTGSGGEALTGPTGVTQRWLNDYATSSGAGNVIGGTVASPGGTATFAWTQTSDTYGVIGVEVQPAITGGYAVKATGAGAALNPSITTSNVTVGPRYAGTATDLGGVYGVWATPQYATGGP